jgi:hypothetical protein
MLAVLLQVKCVELFVLHFFLTMALCDITNTSKSAKRVCKRLANGSVKTYQYNSLVRKHFELTFNNESEKLQFEQKCKVLQTKFGCRSVKDLIVELVEKESTTDAPKMTGQAHSPAGNTDTPNPQYDNYIGECTAVVSLVNIVCQHGQYCQNLLKVTSIEHHGHVVQLKMTCDNNHHLQWSSSAAMRTSYTVNYKVMLAYLCSGISSIEYERVSDFADFGKLSEYFRNTTLVTFSAIIELLRRQSVHRGMAEETSASPEGKLTIMTDARHACRKNSFHSDHVALGVRTHKVINIQHINKDDERCSQKHELVGFERMYKDFEENNVNVMNHVHDRNLSVNKRLKQKGTVKNTNDRWHCTRPITSGLRKIGQGAKRNAGKTWHPELTDKGKLLRNHVYWAMEHCNKDPVKLCQLIDNCVPHFQNDHKLCADESPCRREDYIPPFNIIRDPVAVNLLTKFLQSLVVYKNPEDYIYNGDTYYVESFNNLCLIYLDKRLHYGDRMYELRSNLADWNEHVDRPFTSISKSRYSHHPRRQRGKKVYHKKTYYFVQDIWDYLISVSNDDEGATSGNLESVSSDDDSDVGSDESVQDMSWIIMD